MLTRRKWGTTAAALAGLCAGAQPSFAQAKPPAGPLYFDLHIDTPSRLVSEQLNLAESHDYTCVDIPKMKQGGLNAAFFAVFAPARNITPVEAVKQALKITDVIVEEVKRHPADHARFRFTPSIGDSLVPAITAGRFSAGMMMTRPCTWALSSLRASFMSATGHSYSSPWLPPSASKVGPEPFFTTVIGIRMFAQPARLWE